jgi:hypothetical protein
METLLACGNSGSEPCWPSANYENVCALSQAVHSVTFLYTNLRDAFVRRPAVKSSQINVRCQRLQLLCLATMVGNDELDSI